MQRMQRLVLVRPVDQPKVDRPDRHCGAREHLEAHDAGVHRVAELHDEGGY